MTLLRIDATIQGDRSASSPLADLVLDEVVAAHPQAPVVLRHLGREPLPSDAWQAAVTGSLTPEGERTVRQREALALAREIAGELEEATSAVFAFPLYNFGVSQHVKTWVDLAMAGAPAGSRLLDGTPVALVTTRGGAYGPGTPREGWDHNTAYLQRILGDVWGADLILVERELTLVGVNPALDGLTELATLMRKTAEQAATEAGVTLAGRYAA